MIRSSQATNLYNQLAKNNSGQISSYLNDLLNNSQNETAKTLSNLMLLYMNGYNALADTQKQSLETSKGNSTKTNSSSDGTSFSNTQMTQMMQMALQMALMNNSL